MGGRYNKLGVDGWGIKQVALPGTLNYAARVERRASALPSLSLSLSLSPKLPLCLWTRLLLNVNHAQDVNAYNGIR